MSSIVHRLQVFTAALFGGDVSAHLVVPILSDIDIERRAALASGQRWRARWIVLRGGAGLVQALVLHGLRAVLEEARLFVMVFVGFTIVLALPPLHEVGLGLFFYLLPQAVPLSIPLAMAFAVAWHYRHGDRFASRRRVLIVGVVGSALALATMQWLVPDANQAFRVAVSHRIAPGATSMPRGINELSLSEMARLLRQPSERFSASLVAFQLHVRVALGLSTGVLALLAVALAHGRDRERFPARVFTGIVFIYCLGVTWFSRDSGSSPLLVWLPNASLGALSLVLLQRRSAAM